MDETSVRAYFDRVGKADVPPSTVDVMRARRAGRRRLTVRRGSVPATLLGVAIAAGALFLSGVLPVGAAAHRAAAGGSHHRSALTAPAGFDPLAIWATFGWLPPGYSVATPPDGVLGTARMSEITAAAGPNTSPVSLLVFAAGQCELTGPFWWPQRGVSQTPAPGSGLKPSQMAHARPRLYPAGLRCPWSSTPQFAYPLVPAGHLRGGDPAYVVWSQYSQPIALAWRYATGGWAMLTWQYGAMPSQIVPMAEHVRYGSQLPIPFPFKLAGLPVGWQLSGASYQIERGRIMGNELLLGPSRDPWGRSVVVAPPGYADCVLGSGAQSVSFDGASGVLVDSRYVCFPSLHGMFIWVYLRDHMGAAMSLLPHLRVLGLDPARWTTHPLG